MHVDLQVRGVPQRGGDAGARAAPGRARAVRGHVPPRAARQRQVSTGCRHSIHMYYLYATIQ